MSYLVKIRETPPKKSERQENGGYQELGEGQCREVLFKGDGVLVLQDEELPRCIVLDIMVA